MNTSTKNYIVATVGFIAIIAFVAVGINIFTTPSEPQVATSQSASLNLISPSNGTVQVGDTQHIRYSSTNYSAPEVSVNIIRKVSDNPATYTLVRTVASAKANTGSAVWVPSKTDVGTNTFVQVGCVNSTDACTATPVSGSNALAVIDTGAFSNTAAAYQAIEQLNNK